MRSHMPSVRQATATPFVRADVARQLQLTPEHLPTIESTYREDLFLSRELRPPSFCKVAARVAELLLEFGTPAIVYVAKVRRHDFMPRIHPPP